jgi:formylglycine-generating enzyme
MTFMTRRLTYFIFSLLIMSSCTYDKARIDIDWVYVEGGSFTMGSDQVIVSPAGDSIKGFTGPKRQVKVRDFYISKYEITVKQFREFCKQTNRPMPNPPTEGPYGNIVEYEWRDEYPMLVTWTEASEFAKWAGGRLPTEAEWEYAAKGGKKSNGFSYSGGDIATEVGWVSENADSSLHPIGLLKPNELGIYDMTGNLNEWVADWYNPEKDQLGELDNPTGPPDGNVKISKGVGWYYESVDEKTGTPIKFGIHSPEVRYQSPIDVRTFGFGFRIVKEK